MSSILFRLENNEIIQERVKGEEVAYLLSVGYSATREKLETFKEVDTNDTGKLSSKEIKEAAKKAGIKVGNKSMKTLKEELGL